MVVMDIGNEVEAAGEAAKKHWWVFALALLIYTAWLLSSDLKQSGAVSIKASKWPIVGPYFFKKTSLDTSSSSSPS